MMNRFNFRAWDGKKMYTWKESGLGIFEFNSCKREVRQDGGITLNCYVKNWKDDGLILMQNTGREDAEINGIEVWESDIIENCDTKELQVVYWNEDKAAWYCRYISDESRIVSLADSLGNLNKVIGNIYENPELISERS
jgi:uncharacterized phage protein (TIGR01671 family)